jgi:hypothetical protein
MKEDERAYLAEKGYDPEYISFEEALAIERLCESRASARAVERIVSSGGKIPEGLRKGALRDFELMQIGKRAGQEGNGDLAAVGRFVKTGVPDKSGITLEKK